MLWIALHLPLLSLESFAATLCGAAEAAPLALLDAQHIAHANPAAQALGIKPGVKRATALALAPQLTLGQADPQRDVQALTTVAHIALAFTPSVSLQPAQALAAAPQTVLLEVQRSLRYFGGFDALLLRLHEALAPLPHRIHCVSAPTAQGAAMLARIHPQLGCADLPALHALLDAAPVWLLGPGREHWEALQGMGLRTLADLRRLPRATLLLLDSRSLRQRVGVLHVGFEIFLELRLRHRQRLDAHLVQTCNGAWCVIGMKGA